jgi:hypothetical protein
MAGKKEPVQAPATRTTKGNQQLTALEYTNKQPMQIGS